MTSFQLTATVVLSEQIDAQPSLNACMKISWDVSDGRIEKCPVWSRPC